MDRVRSLDLTRRRLDLWTVRRLCGWIIGVDLNELAGGALSTLDTLALDSTGQFLLAAELNNRIFLSNLGIGVAGDL